MQVDLHFSFRAIVLFLLLLFLHFKKNRKDTHFSHPKSNLNWNSDLKNVKCQAMSEPFINKAMTEYYLFHNGKIHSIC